MVPTDTILLGLTLLAGFYMAWSIGANDVANAMGTSVGSGALTLRRAVLVAAVLEFSGAFFFGSHVSETLQSGIIDAGVFSTNPILLVYGMLAALLATGAWLQLASYFGWPVSTTHAIVGGVAGFGAIVGGVEAIYWENVAFIVTSWIISPLFGGVLSFLIFTLLRRKILYTSNPIAQAKKFTPFFTFIVLTTLSLIMILKGLQNVSFEYSFFEALGISVMIGAIAALISHLLVQRMEENPALSKNSQQSAEILSELSKAKEHLQHVQATSHGEVLFQVNTLLEEMEDVSRSARQTEDKHVIGSEYKRVEKIFGYLQIMSACLMAFAHGANDVANAIGPLSAALSVLKTGVIQPNPLVPTWALALGGFGIVVGLATWGWRVIETIGKRITELTPTRGFAAEFGAAATVLIASRLGLPISTTHTLVGSVVGVGLARGIEALDLSMTRDIVISWVVTVPISAIVTVFIYYTLLAIFG